MPGVKYMRKKNKNIKFEFFIFHLVFIFNRVYIQLVESISTHKISFFFYWWKSHHFELISHIFYFYIMMKLEYKWL